MSDLDLFKKFYSQVGIELKPVNDTRSSGKIVFRIGIMMYSDPDINCSELFEGYNGFYSDVEFDMDGKFIRQGFWE